MATDIVARGIDIEDIGLVINYDVPHDPEDYIHRIGRTARAAATGSAVTFVCEEEQGKFRAIEKFIEKDIRKAELPAVVGEGPAYNPEAFSGRGRGRGGRSKGGDGRGHGRGRRDRLRDNKGRGGSSSARDAQPAASAAAAVSGAAPQPGASDGAGQQAAGQIWTERRGAGATAAAANRRRGGNGRGGDASAVSAPTQSAE